MREVNFTDRDFVSEFDAGTEHSSIVSGHYLRSKSIYSLKKIFNRNYLKPWFDKFVIKLFSNYKRGIKILRQADQTHQLQRLKLHRYLVFKILNTEKRAFNIIWDKTYQRKTVLNKVKRVIRNN